MVDDKKRNCELTNEEEYLNFVIEPPKIDGFVVNIFTDEKNWIQRDFNKVTAKSKDKNV